METNLCVAGFGGQGVMTLGKFLADATCHSTDKNVTFFPSYGAEQRGGTANCFVVISDEEIGAPLGDVMDDLIVMNGPSLSRFLKTLRPGGTLFLNSSIVYVGRTQVIDPAVVWDTIQHKLSSKPKLLPLNKQAFEKGLELGAAQRG